MAPKGRRGVLLTSSKPKPVAVADDESERLQSQREWAELEREAKQIVKLQTTGERKLAAYDDVEDPDAEDLDQAPANSESDSESADEKEEDGKAEPAKDDAEDAGKEPGTGDSEGKPDRKRKRAGKKKSGAQKKREKLEREEQKKEEDEDKWLKLQLAGEEKPRRIAANRIVSYYDFDGRGNPIRFAAGAPRPEVGPMEEDEDFIPGDCLPAPSGNFRANLRPDLWDDSDES
ncbi:unnamed protein product [Effrenium voratum]|uniref:Uncharacterized protein n=1 Tax=Effrenium voratum TaxID=2562239 RepID=A0AA36HQZ6_9DINO|nr:unnamed protein product [Effrenium voratum]CAJ1412240.1 unnamed protein product [Effrenium voratum]